MMENLFEPARTFPDIDARDRLARLVGRDFHRNALVKTISTIVNPQKVTIWADKFHPDASPLLHGITQRPPLAVLAGDVGSGKTELATLVGDELARKESMSVTLLPLSLGTRGSGRVGEITQLLSSAFDQAIATAQPFARRAQPPTGIVIMLVDEADAVVQSRSASQMHHEDRAGVNAFIRGIDRLCSSKSPVMVLLCTNRLGALDPAVRRRCALTLEFERPAFAERIEILTPPLMALGLSSKQVDDVARLTGENASRDHGFTYSDIVQRFIPEVILSAYPASAVDPATVLEMAATMVPSPPFQES